MIDPKNKKILNYRNRTADMECKMKSYLFLVVLAVWLGAIILFSLLYSTSDLKELFSPTVTEAFTESDLPSYIDGEPSGASLSMLAQNRVSPDCCPSNYSTSNGCVCLTNEQLDFIRSRGGNRM